MQYRKVQRLKDTGGRQLMRGRLTQQQQQEKEEQHQQNQQDRRRLQPTWRQQSMERRDRRAMVEAAQVTLSKQHFAGLSKHMLAFCFNN